VGAAAGAVAGVAAGAVAGVVAGAAAGAAAGVAAGVAAESLRVEAAEAAGGPTLRQLGAAEGDAADSTSGSKG
jgi:hypothetical protein